LGLLHGMNKTIPYLRAQKNTQKIAEVKNSIFGVNLLLGLFACGIMVTVSFFVPGIYAPSLRIIALCIFFQQIYLYLFCLLRAENEFGLASRGFAGFSIISTALVVLFAVMFSEKLSGALWGMACALVIVVAYWLLKIRAIFSLQLNWNIIRENFFVGLPILIVGFIDMLFLSIDRWVIAIKLGEAPLGYYALGVMAANLLVSLTGPAVNVLYPHTLERLAVAKNLSDMKQHLIIPIRILGTIILIIQGAAIIVIPLLIQLFLPKYLQSIPILQVLLCGAFFWAIASVSGTFLIAINKQNCLIAVQVVAALTSIVIDVLLLEADYGIMGVAIGTALGYCIYGLGYTLIAIRMVLEGKKERLRFIVQLLTPLGALILAVVAGNCFIGEGTDALGYLISASLRILLLMSVLLLAIWFVNRKINIIARILAELQVLRSS
jgi:O-antigen/teichoic acid export membrane protein